MSTATARKTKRSAVSGQKSERNGNGLSAPQVPETTPSRELCVSEITASAFQNRRDFAADELQGLANTMAKHGLLQPIVVRPLADGYELVAGERRWRAAKLLGWKTIAASVREISDEEAEELVLVENLQRQELNPIEEAIGFQRWLARPGRTQEQLGLRLGRSQGHVANRIRLLELPEEWQGKIISGEIQATHARLLVPWAKFPAVLGDLWQRWRLDSTIPVVPSADEVEDDLRALCNRISRPLKGRGSLSETEYHQVEWDLKPTAEEREELQIAAVTLWNGQKEERAFNEPLMLELIRAQLAKREANAEKRGKKSAVSGQRSEDQKSEEEVAEKREQMQASFARRLYEWKVDWLRHLCAREIGGGLGSVEIGVATQIVCWMAIEAPQWTEDSGRSRLLDTDKRTSDKFGTRRGTGNVWDALGKIDGDGDAVLLLATSALKPSGSHKPWLPAHLVEQIARDLKLDLQKEWAKNRAGELTERYFALHDKSQLLELTAAWKLPWSEAAKKSEIVAGLLYSDSHRTGKMPGEILKAKGR